MLLWSCTPVHVPKGKSCGLTVPKENEKLQQVWIQNTGVLKFDDFMFPSRVTVCNGKQRWKNYTRSPSGWSSNWSSYMGIALSLASNAGCSQINEQALKWTGYQLGSFSLQNHFRPIVHWLSIKAKWLWLTVSVQTRTTTSSACDALIRHYWRFSL